MSFKELTLVGAMALALAACGGGGGGDGDGGDGDGGGGGGNGGETSEPNMTYPGSTTAAQLDAKTAGQYIGLALTSDTSSGFWFTGPAFSSSAPQEHAIRYIKQQRRSAPKEAQAKARIDENLVCDSGSGRMFGEVSDSDGRGSITLSYERCLFQGAYLDGTATTRFDRWDIEAETALDYTTTFSGYRTTYSDGYYQEINGTISYLNDTTCDERVSTNMVGTTPFTSESVWVSSFVAQHACPSDPAYGASSRWVLSGDIYLGAYGRATISTPSPLYTTYVNNGGKEIVAGKLLIRSATGEVTVTGRAVDQPRPNSDYTYLSRIQIDSDRDGGFDYDNELPSMWISFPWMTTDLRDSNNDGIVDGWALYYGIDSALADADGDAISNLAEFRLGTKPDDRGHFSNMHASLASTVEIWSIDSNGQKQELLADYGYGSVNLQEGQRIQIDISVSGNATRSYWVANESYQLKATLPDLGVWSVGNANGCRLSESELELDCSSLSVEPFVADAADGDVETLVTSLQLTVSKGGQGQFTSAAVDMSGYPLNSSASVLYDFYVLETSFKVLPMARVQAYPLNDDVSIYNQLWLTSEGSAYYGQAQPTGFLVKGKITTPVVGLEFVEAGEGQETIIHSCEFAQDEFTCVLNAGVNSVPSGLSVKLKAPETSGSATLNYSVVTMYQYGVAYTHSAESMLVFGLPTDSLQQTLNEAIADGDTEFVLPAGTYVGGLSVTGPVVLNGEAGFELWLTDESFAGNGLGALSLRAGSELHGGSYHIVAGSVPIVFYHTGDLFSPEYDSPLSKISGANFRFYDGKRAAVDAPGDLLVELSKFETVGVTDIDYGPAAITVRGSNATLRNNIFSGDGRLTPVHASSGYGNSSLMIINNTFADVANLGWYEYQYGVVFRNNAVADFANAQDLQLGTINVVGTAPLVYDNLLPARFESAVNGNNIYTDEPMLDPETFAPLPGSPAIDAGVDLSAEFTTDLLGNPRPVGAGFDIGAIEVQAP